MPGAIETGIYPNTLEKIGIGREEAIRSATIPMGRRTVRP